MPWKEVDKVELRRLFVERVNSGVPMSQACREFSISRPTGYKWLRRFERDGVDGLEDRSRKPLRSCSASAQMVEAILSERTRRKWGARKIHKRLQRLGKNPPSERTVNRVLKRAGLQGNHKKEDTPSQRFERSDPNALWQMDHKRAVRGRWRSRAVPFVVLDDHSRYLLCLESLANKGLDSTWSCLWNLFAEVGLPDSILSDNDMVFAGRNGPSQVEARLMRLGIDVVHGRPYHPQTQGKVERFNGTLERELLCDGSFEHPSDLQEGFNRFRYEYNFERPHEALDLEVPASRYVPSTRCRPSVLPAVYYPERALLRKVESSGRISFRNERIDVGCGIAGEWVELREADFGYDVYYGQYRILGFVPGEKVKSYRGYRRIPDGRSWGNSASATPLRSSPKREQV